jgi:hypothetical protein
MTQTVLSPREEREMRMLLSHLREDFASWTTSHDLSRALIAQVNHAQELIDARRYDEARGAIKAVMVAVKAAGPLAWTAP